MTIWAIADLHLAFGCPEKNMAIINPAWNDYEKRIETSWRNLVKDTDLVLIAGDISWAMNLELAAPDFEWIDRLPGTKLISKGNHDYWWGSISQVRNHLPPSIKAIQNDVFIWNEIAIGGARLWDTPEYNFGAYVDWIENPRERKVPKTATKAIEQEKIFLRELQRLEMSLKQFPDSINERLAMLHYPPIGADLVPSRASEVLEKYRVTKAIFGHLHQINKKNLFGRARGIDYLLTSADYIDFTPIKVL